MDDYKKPDGHINFKAYHQAQKDAGERCRQCGGYMLTGIEGVPRTCVSCQCLNTNFDQEVAHEHYIRCPKCHMTFDVHNYASQCDEYDIYQQHDEYEVCCIYCEFCFFITVDVTYTFYSPAIIYDPSAAGD